MAKYGGAKPSTGVPACPDTDLGPFDGGMPGKSMTDRGTVAFESDEQSSKALAEFGAVRTAHKQSSILSHGPVSIPKEGGPDSQRN